MKHRTTLVLIASQLAHGLFAVGIALVSLGCGAWLGLMLALPMAILAWRDAQRSTTGFRLPRAACSTALVYLALGLAAFLAPGSELLPLLPFFYSGAFTLAGLIDLVKSRSAQGLPATLLWALAFVLPLGLFPGSAYLVCAIALMILATLADFLLPLFKLRRSSSTAVLVLLVLGTIPPGVQAQKADEAALFHSLFGEDLPVADPEARLKLASLRVDCPAVFREELIRSFAPELREPLMVKRAQAESLAARIRLRLEASQLFYSILVSLNQIEGDVHELAISVSDGWWWSFDFAPPLDLYVAYRNMDRGGKSLGGTLGLNTRRVEWEDPALDWSAFSTRLAVEQHNRLDTARLDGLQVHDSALILESALSWNISDDLALGLEARYANHRFDEVYYLDPATACAALDSLESLQTGLLLEAGELSWLVRGGLKARALVRAGVHLPRTGVAPWPQAIVGYATGDGALRLDLDERVSIKIEDQLGIVVADASSPPLHPWLLPGIKGYRTATGIQNGSLANQARLSLNLAPLVRQSLGFTELGYGLSLYYEMAATRTQGPNAAVYGQHACGVLATFAFAPPVGRTLALGLGIALPEVDRFYPVLAQNADTIPRAEFIVEVQ